MATNDELEQKVLELTEEWHEATHLDTYTLPEWLAFKLDITERQALYWLYGHREDGAIL